MEKGMKVKIVAAVAAVAAVVILLFGWKMGLLEGNNRSYPQAVANTGGTGSQAMAEQGNPEDGRPGGERWGRPEESPGGGAGKSPAGEAQESPSGGTGKSPAGEAQESPGGGTGKSPAGEAQESPSGGTGKSPAGQAQESPTGGAEESPAGQAQESPYFEREGKQYEKVKDLRDGSYVWASALDEGETILDSHGHERTDYSSQNRYFEKLDGSGSLEVRRWDNLLYSAGDYLIYEYDGTIHVADSRDLYHPVLSYEVGGTYGIITPVEEGYMVSDERSYVITFYDESFQKVKEINGYRTGDWAGTGGYEYTPYFSQEGLMAVRHMETGLMGFMDTRGELAIPCSYALVSPFSGGYAAVLTEAELVPYTEDGGTVAMFDAQGGYWGIIDTEGDFAVVPEKAYENLESSGELDYYNGTRRFTPVREDGTADFVTVEDSPPRVLTTVKVKTE